VHVATLRNEGNRVVVKVQYPESEDLIMADIHSFGFFTRIAQPQAVPLSHSNFNHAYLIIID
jgi:predicted unusual protein kinase regulating ubiquinone biosynthesis (AarF/ABC1/UbiB family)